MLYYELFDVTAGGKKEAAQTHVDRAATAATRGVYFH